MATTSNSCFWLVKMGKINGWQTTDTKWWQKLILPLARFAKKNIKMWIPTCNV
jgi:hypothetical protein